MTWLFWLFVLVFVLFTLPTIRQKLVLYGKAFHFWLYAQEFLETPPKSFAHVGKRTKKVYFIRHGESEWNSIVNEFDMLWLYRMVRIFVLEIIYLFLRAYNSKVLDSPLNPKGLRQAEAAAKALREHLKSPLNAPNRRWCFISSQLRRAIETALIVCDDFVSKTEHPLHIRSELQELSQNVDAYSLCTAGRPPPGFTFSRLPYAHVMERCNYDGNQGNKTPSKPGNERIDAFVSWLIADSEHDVYVIVGHSLWMKQFFGRYVPPSEHATVSYVHEKIKNCGIVSFDLIVQDRTVYVASSTIQAVN